MNTHLAATPLDAWHRGAGARMVPFAGYEMPIQYSSIVAEHHACRTAAALFDVSHMGRIRFDGEGSEQLLDHLLMAKEPNPSFFDCILFSLRFASGE